MYKVLITSHAEKELRRLDRFDEESNSTCSIGSRRQSTAARMPEKVKAEERLGRSRVGDWRIGYEISDETPVVKIITVGHRCEFHD